MAFSLFHILCRIAIMFSEVYGVKEHQHQHGSNITHQHEHGSNITLFVFGDSYVDTGNWRKLDGSSWKEPYGITYPGKPAGRFSDGRVLTDYIASYFGTRSPIPYQQRKSVKRSFLKHGMNFAYGGTGVFNTLVNQPNLTTQINFFQSLIKEKVYGKQQLKSSIVLVSVAGNDYAAFLARNGSDHQKVAAFTNAIINQLATNLKDIHGLGVKRIAITAIEPLGCLPQGTAFSSYKNCNEVGNSFSKLHNQMLEQALQKLNANSKTKTPVYITLDLYNAFTSALKKQEKHAGSPSLKNNPLQPCCVGRENEYHCGSVDESGAKQYIVCQNPKQSFFWDAIHPSQNGWHAIYLALRSSLHKLVI